MTKTLFRTRSGNPDVGRCEVEFIVAPPRLRHLDEEKAQEIAKSMKAIGQLTPIIIRRMRREDCDFDIPEEPADGFELVLVVGRHRLRAAEILGLRFIDVVYLNDGIDARLIEITENLHRADLTAIERAEHIEEWRKLTAEKGREISSPSGGAQPHDTGVKATARKLGVDPKEVRSARKIAGLTPEAKEAARAAGLTTQSDLLKLASYDDGDQVEAVATIVAEKEARREAAKLLGVSERNVSDAQKILKEGTPELIRSVERGEVSLKEALARIAKAKAEKPEAANANVVSFPEVKKALPPPPSCGPKEEEAPGTADDPINEIMALTPEPGVNGTVRGFEMASDTIAAMLLSGSIVDHEAICRIEAAIMIIREAMPTGPEAAQPVPSPEAKPKKKRPKSRPQQFEAAIAEAQSKLSDIESLIEDIDEAVSEARSIQEEYEAWQDNLNPNLAESATGEMLQTVCGLELENATDQLKSAVSELRSTLEEAEGADLPRGYGRD
jgi:ParB family chromosome partitioning protein